MFNRFPTFYNRNTHPRQGYRNFSGAVAGKGKGMSLKTYPASQVFAAAVAAQEQNGEYRKYEQRDPETGAVTARPNKEVMREFLEQASALMLGVGGEQRVALMAARAVRKGKKKSS